jgi:glycosyltransferase involved in cell wall biosynthesis
MVTLAAGTGVTVPARCASSRTLGQRMADGSAADRMPTQGTNPERVGVVIPTVHRVALAERTVDHVLQQRDVDVSVVVVTDGASDEVRPRYDLLRKLDPERVRVVHQPAARGVSRARNLGASLHDTPWLAFCDDDDRWAPDKLRRQLDAIAEMPGARWAAVGCVIVDADDRIIGNVHPPERGDVTDVMLLRNAVPCGGSGVLVERDLFHDAGGFDPACSNSEDWDLWIRLALRSPLACVDAPLVAYLMHDNTTSGRVRNLAASDVSYIEDRYSNERAERRLAFDPAVPAGWVAYRQLRQGSGELAAQLAWQQFRRRPGARPLAQAVLARTAPKRAARIGDWSGARRTPEGWRSDVERWLPSVS